MIDTTAILLLADCILICNGYLELSNDVNKENDVVLVMPIKDVVLHYVVFLMVSVCCLESDENGLDMMRLLLFPRRYS